MTDQKTIEENFDEKIEEVKTVKSLTTKVNLKIII